MPLEHCDSMYEPQDGLGKQLAIPSSFVIPGKSFIVGYVPILLLEYDNRFFHSLIRVKSVTSACGDQTHRQWQPNRKAENI